ncbi:MAG TPA: hypothetical protein VGM84_02185 [Steroidobacteraceae bacterium]|jgi:hypothetical protein
MKPTILIGLAALSACLAFNTGCMMAARAVVHARKPDPGRAFDLADTNGDGIITREEFLAAQERLFDRLDKDHNGVLTKEEAAAARRAP